jgi:hypothetical protein
MRAEAYGAWKGNDGKPISSLRRIIWILPRLRLAATIRMSAHWQPVSGRALNRYNAWAAIRKRAKAAGFLIPVGRHTWRATGITIYLKNDGRLEHAQQMASREGWRRRCSTFLVRVRLHSIRPETLPEWPAME